MTEEKNRIRIAHRSDWKSEPMPQEHDTFILKRSFSKEEMAALGHGNIPQAMEDKWFWYMEGSTLWAHRSWTGYCIYMIEFKENDEHLVTVNRDPEQYNCTSIEEDIRSLNKLLDWWTQTPYDHYNEWLSETYDAPKRSDKPRFAKTSLKQIFESDNIRFVEVSECLINDYLIMVNDYENVNSFIGGKNKQYTAEQEKQWVQRKLEENAAVYSMLEKKSERFIGNIEFMDLTDSQAELGIAITADMQNKGYGTEAIKAMAKYGFDQMGLKRIYLRANPGNARAIYVYEKCGFKEYKRDCEHVYMEVLR
ncbi:MAG: GNAT family N-acetyltransferase [Erysipelotrichaceae bacterium]|nr:GNAT family N-acetyltransferase [Erysipelotrichaceae bacterium]